MSSTYYLCFNFLAIYNTSGTFSDLRRYEFSFLCECEILCEILPTAYVGRTNIVHESVSRMPLIKFVSTSEERANPLVLIKVSTMKCTSSDTCHLGLTSDFMIFLLCQHQWHALFSCHSSERFSIANHLAREQYTFMIFSFHVYHVGRCNCVCLYISPWTPFDSSGTQHIGHDWCGGHSIIFVQHCQHHEQIYFFA